MDISLILGIVITALVVGVPFAIGLSKVLKKHKTLAGKFQALITYIKANPVQDQELVSLIEEIASLFGVDVPPINVASAVSSSPVQPKK
jgi:hypothetical protein